MRSIDREAPTGSPTAPVTARVKALPGLLIWESGADCFSVRCFPLERAMRIGRSSDVEISLSDAAASRVHAEATRSGDDIVVRDLGSTHGVRVNGEDIGDTERRLRLGDVIRIGDSMLSVVDGLADHTRFEKTLLVGTENERKLVGGRSARTLSEFCDRFGPVGTSVFLLGETGTGKDVAAAALHDQSGREGPLVSVNCAALPTELVESQLFGHRKGSFSGALEHNQGYFMAASQGTLFLDEIGELPVAMQGKLLRALETFEVVPVGAAKPIRVDVRIVAATSRDVTKLLEQGAFRRDLYHRLNGVSLWLPPLRERTEELPFLAEFFLHGSGVARFSPPALERLFVYKWPGNVRELRQTVSAAAVRARTRGASSIDLSDLDLPEEIQVQAKVAPNVSDVVLVLKKHQGNVSHAARALGVHRAQLYRVLEENGLSSDDFRRGSP